MVKGGQAEGADAGWGHDSGLVVVARGRLEVGSEVGSEIGPKLGLWFHGMCSCGCRKVAGQQSPPQIRAGRPTQQRQGWSCGLSACMGGVARLAAYQAVLHSCKARMAMHRTALHVSGLAHMLDCLICCHCSSFVSSAWCVSERRGRLRGGG